MKIPKFRNEPTTDWSITANRRKMEAAIAKIESEFNKEYPNLIGGERVMSHEKFSSFNPSNPSEVVGRFQKGTADDAIRALDVALKAFDTWRWVSPEKRAGYLFRAAKIMRRRRHELSATMVLEVGKTWPEADGDIAEAIDFCEFYAREALRYADQKPAIQLPGGEG